MAPAASCCNMGFEIIATRGTAKYLQAAGLEVRMVNKVLEGRPHIVDALKNGEVQLVFNTTEGAQSLAELVLHPPHRAAAEGPLLHDHRGARGRHPGDRRAPRAAPLTCGPCRPTANLRWNLWAGSASLEVANGAPTVSRIA